MEEDTTEKYDELWNRVKALDDRYAQQLLCYLMGFCKHDEHFLKGVEAGLALYEEMAVKETSK